VGSGSSPSEGTAGLDSAWRLAPLRAWRTGSAPAHRKDRSPVTIAHRPRERPHVPVLESRSEGGTATAIALILGIRPLEASPESEGSPNAGSPSSFLRTTGFGNGGGEKSQDEATRTFKFCRVSQDREHSGPCLPRSAALGAQG